LGINAQLPGKQTGSNLTELRETYQSPQASASSEKSRTVSSSDEKS